MTSLNQIQAFLSPIFTPAAPAVVLASQLYAGSVQAGTNETVAMIGAVASGVGMESSGALAFSMILLSMRRKAWGPMVLGIIGVIGYATFAIIGISQAPKGGAFTTFVLMSLVAFLASGLYSYMQDAREDDKTQLQLIRAETDRIQAEKNRTNAEVRLSKASSGVHRPSGQVDSVQAERVRAWYAVHPDASARECARSLSISPTTASKYKNERKLK